MACTGRLMASAWRVVGATGEGLLACLYPPQCSLCEAAIPHDSDPPLCAACLVRIPPIGRDVCLKCGAPQGPHVGTVESCQSCKGLTPGLKRTVAVGEYAGFLEEAVKSYKYGRRLHQARALGLLLAGQLQGEPFLDDIDAVTYVPLHWRRAIERGFDQAEQLAVVVARRLGRPLWRNVLARTRATPRQAALPYKTRRRNLDQAFRVRRGWAITRSPMHERVRDRTLLLVDDVMTTGATLTAAATALKRAGAKAVYGAVVARTR